MQHRDCLSSKHAHFPPSSVSHLQFQWSPLSLPLATWWLSFASVGSIYYSPTGWLLYWQGKCIFLEHVSQNMSHAKQSIQILFLYSDIGICNKLCSLDMRKLHWDKLGNQIYTIHIGNTFGMDPFCFCTSLHSEKVSPCIHQYTPLTS